MSTVRKLDPSHRLERNRRREALASIMLASPHTRLGAVAPRLYRVYHSPALSGAEKTNIFMRVIQWANSRRNENWSLKRG